MPPAFNLYGQMWEIPDWHTNGSIHHNKFPLPGRLRSKSGGIQLLVGQMLLRPYVQRNMGTDLSELLKSVDGSEQARTRH